CPRCNKTIYHAEKVVGPGGPWHRQCFKCKQCSTTLNSTKLTEHEGEAFCQTCYTKLFSPRGYNIGGSTEPLPYQSRPQLPPRSPSENIKKPPRASSSLADFGMPPPDICPRCNDRIYAAEHAMAAGRKYHKFCIKCKACDTSINSLQITERDGEIFCRTCYAKKFGPKGF
ncbi:LIM-domain-containing protein, partial [Coemansia reversa NRRL 1564]